MYRLFRDSIADFRSSFFLYLSFELIYYLLASLIFSPILMYAFNKLLIMLGKGGALLNQDVFMLGLSFKGLIGLFVISFFAVAVLFVEFGTLIMIAHKRYLHEPVFVSDAWVSAIGKLPKLLGLGIFQLFFLLLLVIPFLDASTLPPLLDINITLLLTDVFRESLLAQLMYLLLFLAIVYLYIRWIYVLHFIFIDNQSIWHALGSSWRLTGHGKVRLVVVLVLWNMLVAAVGFLTVTLISWTAKLLDMKVVGDFIGNYLSTVSSYVTIILSLILIPINVIILTRMFHRSFQKTGLLRPGYLKLVHVPFLTKIETAVIRLFKRGRSVVIAVIVLILTLGFVAGNTINETFVYLPWDVEIAGHKGDGFSAPENTIASVKSGISKGVDAVEIDVTLTKDDVLVLSHDQDLTNIADLPIQIRDLTYKELSKIDIGSHFDESYAGETIPKLDDVLDVITKADTNVIIDVKTELNETTYAKEISRLVDKHDAEALASVQSFNTDFLKEMRRYNSTIDIGQILYLSAGSLSGLDVDFYTVRESMLTKRFIKKAKRENRDIWVWTVNSKRNIKEVLSYDIDGIITDYPLKVQRMLDVELAGEAEKEGG